MSDLTPILNNQTNNELIIMAEMNGYVVNKDMVKVLCERLDNTSSQLRMFNSLNDKMVQSNKKLMEELKLVNSEIAEIMGDEI